MTSDLSTRQARLAISPELLKQLLYLPDDAEILSASAQYNQDGKLDWVGLYVRHPDLPALVEDETPPTIAPTYEVTESPQTVTMLNWGLA